MCASRRPGRWAAPGASLLPARALTELVRLLGTTGELTLRLGEREATFEVGSARLSTRLGPVAGHEGPDPAFGIRPEPAAGAELANELPVVQGLATEGAVTELVDAQKGVDVREEGMTRHRLKIRD